MWCHNEIHLASVSHDVTLDDTPCPNTFQKNMHAQDHIAAIPNFGRQFKTHHESVHTAAPAITLPAQTCLVKKHTSLDVLIRPDIAHPTQSIMTYDAISLSPNAFIQHNANQYGATCVATRPPSQSLGRDQSVVYSRATPGHDGDRRYSRSPHRHVCFLRCGYQDW
jgi:hypothetical protein